MNEKALKLIRPVLKRDQVKDRRERESYLFSAAQHEKIVEALPKLSGAKLRALMRDSISDWRTEVFNAALPRESE